MMADFSCSGSVSKSLSIFAYLWSICFDSGDWFFLDGGSFPVTRYSTETPKILAIFTAVSAEGELSMRVV